ERGVFNGDVGFVARVLDADNALLVSIDGRGVRYDRAQLDELVLAYAVSVHKAQGSEYPAVVMPVTTQHFKMLQRNLLYTGITRGKRLVVLVGTPRAMGIAVRNRDVAHRHTMLCERLRGKTALGLVGGTP
ncbi:MAG: ATP-binding domain-containing protein, partial [Myxococcota bacterium]|nr:ATP-binding domain-containing protein [Myxococcota bacterium]